MPSALALSSMLELALTCSLDSPVSRQWRKLRRILGAPGFLISRRKALRPLPLPCARLILTVERN